MQDSDDIPFFSDEEIHAEVASVGEKPLSDCLLEFDIHSVVDFVIGEDSSSLDLNILLSAGNKYKKYERMLSVSPEIAVMIETQRFKFTITRNQISAKLYYQNACGEFLAVYRCLISALIPIDLKSHLKIFSQSTPSSESAVKTGQLILEHLQEGRVQDNIEFCNTSPTKSISSESGRLSTEVFLPKITASVAMTIGSFRESFSPRSSESPRPLLSSIESSSPRELVTPSFNGSPRSKSSPRFVDSALALTPSPRDESSARETSSPRLNGATRLLCFFKKIGSEHFAIKKSPGRSPRNLPVSDEAISPRRRVSNADMFATHSEAVTTQSAVRSLSVPDDMPLKEIMSSIKIQKSNSFVTSSGGCVPTEIQYSPRNRSLSETGFSPRGRTQSRESLDHDSVTDILLYCGTEVIAWCDSLSLSYRKVKHEFVITLPNKDVIRIQGHRIHANSLECSTVNLLIDLIKVLPQVENVSIYYVSQGTHIDESIVTRLSSSPAEPDVSKHNPN